MSSLGLKFLPNGLKIQVCIFIKHKKETERKIIVAGIEIIVCIILMIRVGKWSKSGKNQEPLNP